MTETKNIITHLKIIRTTAKLNGEMGRGIPQEYCKDIVEWMDETLELLKAKRPRVLSLEEVKASKGADVYLEISKRIDEIPYITAATLDGVGTNGVSFYCSSFDFVTYNRRLFGWRCWTYRPTDEQREEVKWDE